MNDIWQENCKQLRLHLTRDSLSDFLQWSTVQATMFVGNAPYIEREYDCLLGSRQSAQWVRAIKEPWIGSPTPFNDFTSGNLIHQAYHLKQWLDRTQQKLSEMSTIVEFGAGYGAMALIIYRLGFRGKYYIVDLPEPAFLQQSYLNKALPEDWSNIYWLSALPSSKLSGNLFIASHSLGEVPEPERERLLSQVEAKEYLFVSSYEFEGVDNQGWFQQLAGSIMGLSWVFYPHKYYENAFYMVGVEL